METDPRTAYIQVEGVFRQLWWDNSSLALLRACPRKYYYAIVLGLRPGKPNPHLIFGMLYHSALEYNDHLIAQGISNLTQRARMVCRKVLEMSWGWESDHKIKNRIVLVRAVMAYVDHFRNDAAKTILLASGKPAVELSFRFEIDLEGPWGKYGLCGHLDRIAEFDGNRYILDRKTTARNWVDDYIKSFKPSGQMQQYTSGGQIVFVPEISGALIDAVYLASNLDTFGRFAVTYTKAQMEEWLDNTMYYIKSVEVYHQAMKWPMNLESCHVYDGCVFRRLCGRDPSVREHWIKADYQVDRWDPLVTREVSE